MCRNWGMEPRRIHRTARNLRSRNQNADLEICWISLARIYRPPERAYNPTHDTAQTHAHWAGNPIASRSLDRCDAARLCDARASRRLNPPDDPPPFPRECHTGNAAGSAPRDERQNSGNRNRCPTRQPTSPHAEEAEGRLEARGRARHPSHKLQQHEHPIHIAPPQLRSSRRKSGPRASRVRCATGLLAQPWIPAFAGTSGDGSARIPAP